MPPSRALDHQGTNHGQRWPPRRRQHGHWRHEHWRHGVAWTQDEINATVAAHNAACRMHTEKGMRLRKPKQGPFGTVRTGRKKAIFAHLDAIAKPELTNQRLAGLASTSGWMVARWRELRGLPPRFAPGRLPVTRSPWRSDHPSAATHDDPGAGGRAGSNATPAQRASGRPSPPALPRSR